MQILQRMGNLFRIVLSATPKEAPRGEYLTNYKELYQQTPLFTRKKVVKVYQETKSKSLTAKIFKTHLCVLRDMIKRFEHSIFTTS